ncbi:MAG TPA: AI-2E family transporter, partial [Candidatus Caenarcaniphilales bacterium]
LFSNFFAIVLNLLLVLILTIMLLGNPSPYRQGFVKLFPAFYRRRIDEILSECDVALGGWLAGILFNMAVITVLSGLGLLFLQVPLALVNALLAGLLTFIPNVGPTLSVIPPVAIALLDAPWKAIAVLILYILIQQIESNILTPTVMQKQVSLLPAVTLVSQVIFAIFFGFLGLILALPLLVVARVWLREILIKDVLDNWHLEKNAALTPDGRSTGVLRQAPSSLPETNPVEPRESSS